MKKVYKIGLYVLIGLLSLGLGCFLVFIGLIRSHMGTSWNSCANNLNRIDGAKEQWAVASGVGVGSNVSTSGVNECISGVPACNAHGEYIYNTVGIDPRCSVHNTISDPTFTEDEKALYAEIETTRRWQRVFVVFGIGLGLVGIAISIRNVMKS